MRTAIRLHDVGLKPRLIHFLEETMFRQNIQSRRWFCRVVTTMKAGVIGNDLPITYVNIGCVIEASSYQSARKIRPYFMEIVKKRARVPELPEGTFNFARNGWYFFKESDAKKGLSVSVLLSSYDGANFEPLVESMFHNCNPLVDIVLDQIKTH